MSQKCLSILNLVFVLTAVIMTFLPYPLSGQAKADYNVTVVGSDGYPVPGAAVVLKGTNTGFTADADGKCLIQGATPGMTAVISCLGFDDAEIELQSKSNVRVVIRSSNLSLDDVVVVGYGTQRRKDLSGAITKLEGDVLNEFSTTSVANALQGRVSGVQVSSINGQPGADIQVRIRGANSIKGSNEPLWIINGFPGNINMINTSDIESIEVLKDASATAIYGSRGANGVVIVTTRHAKEGKMAVSYNGSIGVQTLSKQLDMLSGNEYMNYLNEKAAIQGKDAVFENWEIGSNEYDTNWQNEVFHPAVITSHSVNVTGGTRTVQSSLGLSYYDQEGIVRKSGYQRLSFSADVNYNISDVLSANGSIIYSHADQNRMSSQGGSRGTSVIDAALTTSPLATPHYDDGTWNDFQTQPSAGMNPIAYLYEVKNNSYNNRVMATAGLTIRPLSGLSIQLSANVYNGQARTDYYKSTKYPNSNGAASISLSENTDITSNNIVTYDKDFGRHSLRIMGGVTYEESTSKTVGTGTAYGFLSDATQTFDMDAAGTKGLPTSSYSNWKLLSFLGRLNYNYDNRYLLTVNFRSDGSSRYSIDNKWGYFPSAAFAWRASQEHFLRDLSWLSNLKIRAGYGVTGSTAISPYSTQNTLESVNVVFDKTTESAQKLKDTYLGGLKWESTAQFNTGFDVSFFKERLSITADYYVKKTTNLLNDVEMPRSSGYTTALRNIGSIRNSGVEVQLDARIIDKTFKWDFGANFSLNRSEVLKLADGNDIFGGTVSNTIISDQLNIMREGEQMYLFYGYVEEGYDDNGQIVYKDTDKDGSVTPADKAIIGNPNPDFLLNFNTTFSYKGFALSAFFQGSFGNELYNLTAASLGYDYTYNTNVLKDVFYDHWNSKNLDAKYPNLISNLNLKMSDRFVEDGSYLRLKNLELSYDIPVRKTTFIHKAIVSVSAQNLLTITSYPMWNPDVNANGGDSSIVQGVDSNCYPIARTFTVGCKLVF